MYIVYNALTQSGVTFSFRLKTPTSGWEQTVHQTFKLAPMDSLVFSGKKLNNTLCELFNIFPPVKNVFFFVDGFLQ